MFNQISQWLRRAAEPNEEEENPVSLAPNESIESTNINDGTKSPQKEEVSLLTNLPMKQHLKQTPTTASNNTNNLKQTPTTTTSRTFLAHDDAP